MDGKAQSDCVFMLLFGDGNSTIPHHINKQAGFTTHTSFKFFWLPVDTHNKRKSVSEGEMIQFPFSSTCFDQFS